MYKELISPLLLILRQEITTVAVFLLKKNLDVVSVEENSVIQINNGEIFTSCKTFLEAYQLYTIKKNILKGVGNISGNCIMRGAV